MNSAIVSGSSEVSVLTWLRRSVALIALRSVCRAMRSDCTSARFPSSDDTAVPVSSMTDSSSVSMPTASPTSTRCESSAEENAPTVADSDDMDWLSPGKVPDNTLCSAPEERWAAAMASDAAAV